MEATRQQIDHIRTAYQQQTGQQVSVEMVRAYINAYRDVVGGTALDYPAELAPLTEQLLLDSQPEVDPKAQAVDPSYLERADYQTSAPTVIGCTDPAAYNYDPNATVDQGCVAKVYGCTDPDAFNYDPQANVDQGCLPVVYGCTDPANHNYDPQANVDQGCATSPKPVGCPDPKAVNYDPQASPSAETCRYQSHGWGVGWNFVALSPFEEGNKVYDFYKSKAALKTDGKVDPAKVLQYGIDSGYASQQTMPRIGRPLATELASLGTMILGWNPLKHTYDTVPESWAYMTLLLSSPEEVESVKHVVRDFIKKNQHVTTIAPEMIVGCMDKSATNYDPSASIPKTADCRWISDKWEMGWNLVALSPRKYPDGQVFNYYSTVPELVSDGQVSPQKMLDYGVEKYRSQQTTTHMPDLDWLEAADNAGLELMGWDAPRHTYVNIFDKQTGELANTRDIAYLTILILDETMLERFNVALLPFGWRNSDLTTDYIVPLVGCMDKEALNFNPLANVPATRDKCIKIDPGGHRSLIEDCLCGYSHNDWAIGWNFIALNPFTTKKGDVVDVYRQDFKKDWTTNGQVDPKKVQTYGSETSGYASQQTLSRMTPSMANALRLNSTNFLGWDPRTFTYYNPQLDNWAYAVVLLLNQSQVDATRAAVGTFGWDDRVLSEMYTY